MLSMNDTNTFALLGSLLLPVCLTLGDRVVLGPFMSFTCFESLIFARRCSLNPERQIRITGRRKARGIKGRGRRYGRIFRKGGRGEEG